MNKILTSLTSAVCVGLALIGSMTTASAQNIQLHYDLGRHVYPTTQAGRPYITATIEQKSLDKWGDTFYFVDMSFLSQGAVQANWKFLRNLRFWRGPLSWHLRYDGGLRFVNAPQSNVAISMRDAFFTGATYSWRLPSKRLMINFTAAYKYIKNHESPHNWELTTVWNYTSETGFFNATGFATWWQERDARWGTRYKFMSQPQFWLNLDRIQGVSDDFRLSVGTEIRISNNVDANRWLVVPTLALRWSFGK